MTSGLRARDTLALALAFGLLNGVLEAGFRGAQIVLGMRSFLSPDVVWMAPLGDVALMLGVTAVLLVPSLGGPSRLGAAPLVGVYVTLVALGPLLITTRIHWAASCVLAAGLGAFASRLTGRDPHRVIRVARRGVLPLAGLVVIGAVAVRGGRALAEWRHEAALAAPTGSPNVLLLILDTVRAEDLSAYGYERRTSPHLEMLAESGTLFEHAWSTSPWTLPSHASLFTGRYPHELSADWLAPLDDTHATLAERFRRSGYRTGGFVGNLIYATYETGLNRGFSRYEDYPVSLPMVASSSLLLRKVVLTVRRLAGEDDFLVKKPARDVNDSFLRWVDQDADRPFFAFLNFMDAHAPYLPPDSLDGRFGPRRTGRALADLSERREWAPDELRAERAAYDGTIAYVDQELGYLLTELERRGKLSQTLVVVASDHGEQFGEHDLVDHGNSLYRPLLEVPLVISWPGRVPAGLRVERPVTLRDVPATIVQLALGDPPGVFPGTSLVGDWRGTAISESPLLSEVRAGIRMPEWLPIMRGDMKSILHENVHYILNGDGVEEAYDFRGDVGESHNLVDSRSARQDVGAARDALQAALGGT